MGRSNKSKDEQNLTSAPELEQAAEPAQVAEPDQTPEPAQVAEPDQTPEPEQVAEPDQTPEPVQVAESAQATEPEQVYVVCAEHGLNKRTGPGRKFRVLHVLPCGIEVVVIGPMVTVEGSLWAPVDGGWVCAEYLALQAEA